MAKKMTNYLAGKVAKSLVLSTIGVDIENVKKEIEDFITPVLISKIPEEIILLWEKYPKFFKTTTSVRLVNENNHADNVYCKCGNHPAIETYGVLTDVSIDILKKVQLLNMRKEQLEEKANLAENNIKSALLELSTFKRIKENFPEAFALIPADEMDVSISASLSVPIDSIRNLLKAN